MGLCPLARRFRSRRKRHGPGSQLSTALPRTPAPTLPVLGSRPRLPIRSSGPTLGASSFPLLANSVVTSLILRSRKAAFEKRAARRAPLLDLAALPFEPVARAQSPTVSRRKLANGRPTGGSCSRGPSPDSWPISRMALFAKECGLFPSGRAVAANLAFRWKPRAPPRGHLPSGPDPTQPRRTPFSVPFPSIHPNA